MVNCNCLLMAFSLPSVTTRDAKRESRPRTIRHLLDIKDLIDGRRRKLSPERGSCLPWRSVLRASVIPKNEATSARPRHSEERSERHTCHSEERSEEESRAREIPRGAVPNGGGGSAMTARSRSLCPALS